MAKTTDIILTMEHTNPMHPKRFETPSLTMWPAKDTLLLLSTVFFTACIEVKRILKRSLYRLSLPASRKRYQLLSFWIIDMKRNLMITQPRSYSFIPSLKIVFGSIFSMVTVILMVSTWKISRTFFKDNMMQIHPRKRLLQWQRQNLSS